MLTLTENASTIVRDITTQPGLPDGAGLRITAEGSDAFEITAADSGEPSDKTLEQSGATIYLDEQASQVLDDKILDAAVTDDGRVEFALASQG